MQINSRCAINQEHDIKTQRRQTKTVKRKRDKTL